MKKEFQPLCLALALLALTGCGLKGPLYFPSQEKAAQPVAPQQTDSAQHQSTVSPARQ
ncbi:hypothetical protein FJU30_21835 [Affinibrenneria salicis]|uniref:LPS-assembly lipoprotein LptM n=1 Tax=Affinibrenneria salicis TaxID=2590031 RepID=A0A5J5FT81_9GAMM|nr:lipoprotein [Affinibrenneria salicis]KAA8996435.1 hypothetical protein FJU30_21835 [Affinibrenneria salicis]